MAVSHVELPDGRMVACDPHDPAVPLARRLPPGRYAAQLRVVDLGGRDQRTTAVLLRADDTADTADATATDEATPGAVPGETTTPRAGEA